MDDLRAMQRRALPILVLLTGLVLTSLLSWACFVVHDANENRLLRLQVRQAASVVSEAIPSIQLPLVSASQLAQATDGNTSEVLASLLPFVGAKGHFSAASLWNVSTSTPQLVGRVGSATASTQSISDVVVRARHGSTLIVQANLRGPTPYISYADSAGPKSDWVVASESTVPTNRKLKVASNSAFGNINYALYLGRTTAPDSLFGSSVPTPITGRSSVVTVPFGSSALTLVGTPKGELGGNLLANLVWIVAIVGATVSFAAAILTTLLMNREHRAEVLADENRQLYSEQRSIAETLQHAILPQSLPKIRGIEAATRYISGSEDVEVGGDWYDFVVLDDTHFVFVLGDVSGKGVQAASLMARVSHAIEAYALEMEPADVTMTKVSEFFGTQDDGTFATVIFAAADVPRHEVTLISAGHPPPLLVTHDGAGFVPVPSNPPLGIRSDEFAMTRISVPPGATLVAFTDGLFERRGEALDVGLERIRSAAPLGNACSLEIWIDEMLDRSQSNGSDDTAIVAIRWLS